MDLQEILRGTQNLSYDDLRIVNKLSCDLIQLKRKQVTAVAKAELHLSEGEQVKVNHDKVRGQIGTVKSVNRTTASVQFPYNGILRVPLALIQKAN